MQTNSPCCLVLFLRNGKKANGTLLEIAKDVYYLGTEGIRECASVGRADASQIYKFLKASDCTENE